MKKIIAMQLFAETNMTATADMTPEISVDFVSKITQNIRELQEVLGITEMEPMASGTTVKIYKMEQVNTPDQVGEGETIALTKIQRTLVKTIDLTLEKFRRNTSAELIQKVGREMAINQADEKLVKGIQKAIKQKFYDVLLTGTGTADGTTLQSTLANIWGALQKKHEDEEVTPVYFVSPDDVADYLGNAQITMQNAFGMSYIKDFLGLGTVIVTPRLAAGQVIGCAKENLHGVYIPANSGDVARTFGLTSDTTGLVGMNHSTDSTNATVNTLAMAGVVFYPELLDAVVIGTIAPAGA